ncbi:hypothetical protein MKX03_024047 [Papaver bracteatum]|nr:hypothetical protein MKX03_024047 [Papaver bracteatum]
MFRYTVSHRKLCLIWIRRNYSSGLGNEILDPTSKLCKIMIRCPKVGLEASLNESGIKVSTEMVEDVLHRFENGGMQAYKFFEWAQKQKYYTHSVRAYHIMIGSLAKVRQYQIMWDLVNKMRDIGILNVETFCIIMRKYTRAKKVDEAIYTFNFMDKYGITPNLAAFNSLLSALCKSRNVRKAQEIFESMKEDRFVPDAKTYSILLEGWGKAPNLPKAREIFREMVDTGCQPDIVTYGIMVDVLCKAGRVDEAVGVVKDMDSAGCKPSTYIYTVLVHTYGIDNRIGDAVDTFLDMEKNGVAADVTVYNALIGAFCKVNRFKNVPRVLEEMDRKGVVPNSRTTNIILNSLIKRGETDEAFSVFRRMMRVCDPDADSYTMMIKMFCDNGELDKALKVWKVMNTKRFIPSMHTFSVLINGLCDKGEVSKACVFMEQMIEKGIQPSVPTFGKLRQLLIKENREDVLEFLVEKMKLLVKDPLWD